MSEPGHPRGATAPVVAAGQAGAFTRCQARAEGWSDGQVARRVRSGAWRRLAGRALVVTSLPTEPLTRAWAVHLTWPDAVASHGTAAAVHGFPGPAAAVAEATSSRRRRSLADLRAYQDDLDAADVVLPAGGSGPRLTTRRRTALDRLLTLHPLAADALLAWVVSRCADRRRGRRLGGARQPRRLRDPHRMIIVAGTNRRRKRRIRAHSSDLR